MSYRIGQIIPHEPGRGLQGEPLPHPVWHCFWTPPQKEAAAIAWLDRRGVHGWRPVEKRWRRAAHGKRKRVEYEASVVPRYIFARYEGVPQWDILRSCRWISGIVGVGGVPVCITDDTLAEMKVVPDTLAAIQAAKQAARIISDGCQATIMDGPMAGWVVDVGRVSGAAASVVVPALGEGEAKIEANRLNRAESR